VLAKLPARQGHSGSAHATARSQLHPLCGRSLGEDASSSRRSWPKPRSGRQGSPSGCSRPKPRAPTRALSGWDARPSAEAEWACVLVPRVASHRHPTEVEDRCKTRSTGNPTAAPMGFGPFRRFRLREALPRVTSPGPSALGVSHPLSGLILPGPRGFVSRHIRP
jgi:hypothetical protein